MEPPFLSRLSLLSPLYRQDAALADLDALPLQGLVISTDDSVPLSFGKDSSDVFANCLLCGTESTLSFSKGSAFSSFSSEAYAILQALSWSRQHKQDQRIFHFSFLFLLSVCLILRFSFYLILSGTSGRNYLLSFTLLSSYNA